MAFSGVVKKSKPRDTKSWLCDTFLPPYPKSCQTKKQASILYWSVQQYWWPLSLGDHLITISGGRDKKTYLPQCQTSRVTKDCSWRQTWGSIFHGAGSLIMKYGSQDMLSLYGLAFPFYNTLCTNWLNLVVISYTGCYQYYLCLNYNVTLGKEWVE